MFTNTQQDNDLSFLEKKDANALSGKDIFYTVVRNIHWLILCAAVLGLRLIISVTGWTVSTRVMPVFV